MIVSRAIAPALFAVALATCSSKSTPSGATSGGPGSACLLAFYSADYDARCQPALDQACCQEEKTCGVNFDCAKLVYCINGCPWPRTDSCINACGNGTPSPPGYAELTAVANCGKGPGYKNPGASCAWP